MKIFNDLSVIQMEKYKSICGYDYVPNSLKGDFATECPYDDKEWSYSPWYFSFQFHQDTGFLYCMICHRMTNDRAYGWDYEGNELETQIVDKVYKWSIF